MINVNTFTRDQISDEDWERYCWLDVTCQNDPVGPGGLLIHRYVRGPRRVTTQERRNLNQKLRNAILDGLRQTVDTHGPITRELIGSAVKRVMGCIRSGNIIEEIRNMR